MKTIKNPNDKRLDKFYDETPQAAFTFQLIVTGAPHPYELYYKERLDGDDEYNRNIVSKLQDRAQADMFNILQRLQARDPDMEFSSWIMLDSSGAVIKQSRELSIYVKPQLGAPNG